MWWLLLLIPAALVLFLLVILLRALAFQPKTQGKVDEASVEIDREALTRALSQLITYRTVSYRDPALEDDSQFEGLINALPSLFPQVARVSTMERFPDRGLLFRWKGKHEGSPTVIMAHYDVVPVVEEGWSEPAFEGLIKDGCIWGRGTLDTKVTLCSALFAANKLISEGFIPTHDIYFAFSGGEEVNGKGAVHIVDYFEKNHITPALVLDEGGAVVENVFPGVKAACGLIGIAEKGMMDVQYTVHSQGGHASAPKPGAPVDRLANACCKVLKTPFKVHLTPPVAEMFDTLGRHSSFLYRVIFANIGIFLPILDLICKKSGGELNALMRTTTAFTQMKGSSASNVIPPQASLVCNMRLNPKDTMESALADLQKKVKDPRVEICALQGMNPSRISRTDVEGYDKVASAVAGTWKGCIVSPYLMVQCSDSRHWGRISDRVYRFSAMDLTSEERATIHGNNERIRIDCLTHAAEFYVRLMKQC